MKRLRDKVVVQPLDEVRLARIERDLFAAVQRIDLAPHNRRTRQPIGQWLWPAAALTCAAAALLLWIRTPESAQAAETQFEIATDASPTAVTIERASLAVSPSTRALVRHRAGASVTVELGDGRIGFDVDKRPDRPAFKVIAADIEVTVVGTAFVVERAGPHVSVSVERGVVAVTRGDKSVRVAAGESWQTPALAASAATVDVDVQALVDSGQTVATAPTQATGDHSGTAELEARGQGAPATSSSNRKPAPGARRAGTATKSGVSKPALGKAVAFKPFRAPRGLDPIMPAAMGSPADVERHLRGLSVQTGDAAMSSHALYSLMYWQLYRMRSPSSAIQSADRYERRFRRAKNAESALWVRVAALCAASEKARCRAAAHSYIQRYPGGRFSKLAKGIVDNRE